MRLCMLAFSLVFTAYLSAAVVSGKTPNKFQALVVLKTSVSLTGRLVACSARIAADRQTETHTERLRDPEEDSQPHLGILRSVSISTLLLTSERCSAGRSAYFSLNAIGARFGCLHPATIRIRHTVYLFFFTGVSLEHHQNRVDHV